MPLCTSLYFPCARLYAFDCLLCACLYAVHCLLPLCVASMHASMNFTAYSVHATMHLTLYFPCACLHAFHCVPSLRMPLRISLGACPTHAFPARALCISLCTLPAHAFWVSLSTSLTCIYALHSVLALRMPLCISLSTFSAHASTRFTVYPAHVTVYFPSACLCAFHSVLALRMPLCVLLCMRFFVCSPTLQPEPELRLLVRVMLVRAGKKDRYAFLCVLSLHVALLVALSTFPVDASMHMLQYLPYACLYAFHGLQSLRMRLCIPLCTCSTRFTVHFPYTCLYALHYLLSPYAVELHRTQRLTGRTLRNAVGNEEKEKRKTRD